LANTLEHCTAVNVASDSRGEKATARVHTAHTPTESQEKEVKGPEWQQPPKDWDEKGWRRRCIVA